mmetsp:Transcript_51668/g.123000  ORF Transcript_51668/g.123000 Transcript_51668/m.123000 type:complete len:429 (-) Transcript_51668:8-1294(-)
MRGDVAGRASCLSLHLFILALVSASCHLASADDSATGLRTADALLDHNQELGPEARRLLEDPLQVDETEFVATKNAAGSSAEFGHKGGHDGLACIVMSLIAGLATTVGALVVFILPGGQVTPEQLSFSLALAGGVMVSVTVLEFWLPALLGDANKRIMGVLVFSCLGVLAFVAMSSVIPEPDVVGVGKREVENASEQADGEDDTQPLAAGEHETCTTPGSQRARSRSRSPGILDPAAGTVGLPEQGTEIVDVEAQALATGAASTTKDLERARISSRKARHWRLALVMMLSLTAHNFPEGFAVAVSAFESKRLGFVVMLAITLHNIPEGIAIAVPVLAATGSRAKALLFSLLSGAAEPLGAATSVAVLNRIGEISEASMENLLCTVGGVMTAVAVKELFPEAWAQGCPRAFAAGTITGVMVMLITVQYV